MTAAARLTPPQLYAATHLKSSHRFLKHASNTQRTHALALFSTTGRANITARAPLQQHLHFLHATPHHKLHYPRSPAPRRPVHHVHTGDRGGQSTARGRQAAAHVADCHTRRKLRQHVTEGRRRLFSMPLHAWRLQSEEPRRRLYELERAHDESVKLLARLQLAVGDEGK
jgi:CRISPR/Cas system endoribonuclease Cas6 (RAMP superfamily)